MTRTSELVAIGTRDITPPEGRVTLELRSATTGRLRKRVVVENALMDWYKDAVLRNGGRGPFDQPGAPTATGYSAGLNPLAYAQLAGTVVPESVGGMAALLRPGAWPSPLGVARNCTNWLWATGANVSPDASRTQIPTVSGPEVTAGAKLDWPTYAADGIQNKRGGPNLALSSVGWNQIRMVVDFSTAEGNGTYRSVGIGNLINQRISPGGLRAYPAATRFGQPIAPDTAPNQPYTTLTGAIFRQALGQNTDIWWIDTGYQLVRRDMAVFSAAGNGATAFTVSAANVPGSGGPNGPTVVVTPSDFWVARNQVLYRCVTPVSNVAMTVTNTYNLAGTLGAETIQDITFDGTNLYLLTATKVYVVNPATGASTSNWAHGRTAGTDGYASIEYDSAEQLLWMNFVDRTVGGTAQWGIHSSGSNIALNYDSLICYGYPVAGTSPTKWFMGRHTGYGGSAQQPSIQLTAMSADGRFFFRHGSDGGYTFEADLAGPSMATHALLPSDVVKTSDDVLRITYDFNFA